MINKLPESPWDPSCGIIPSNTTWSQGMTFSEGNYVFFPLNSWWKSFQWEAKRSNRKSLSYKSNPLWKGAFQGPQIYLSPRGQSSGKDQSGLWIHELSIILTHSKLKDIFIHQYELRSSFSSPPLVYYWCSTDSQALSARMKAVA